MTKKKRARSAAQSQIDSSGSEAGRQLSTADAATLARLEHRVTQIEERQIRMEGTLNEILRAVTRKDEPAARSSADGEECKAEGDEQCVTMRHQQGSGPTRADTLLHLTIEDEKNDQMSSITMPGEQVDDVGSQTGGVGEFHPSPERRSSVGLSQFEDAYEGMDKAITTSPTKMLFGSLKSFFQAASTYYWAHPPVEASLRNSRYLAFVVESQARPHYEVGPERYQLRKRNQAFRRRNQAVQQRNKKIG